MNTTLNSVTVQRFRALQTEIIPLGEQDYAGLSPKLEQIIRAFELTQIELVVFRDRGYGTGLVGRLLSGGFCMGCTWVSTTRSERCVVSGG